MKEKFISDYLADPLVKQLYQARLAISNFPYNSVFPPSTEALRNSAEVIKSISDPIVVDKVNQLMNKLRQLKIKKELNEKEI